MVYYLGLAGLILFVGIRWSIRRQQQQLAAENAVRETLELPPLTARQFRRKFIDTHQFRKGMSLHS